MIGYVHFVTEAIEYTCHLFWECHYNQVFKKEFFKNILHKKLTSWERAI